MPTKNATFKQKSMSLFVHHVWHCCIQWVQYFRRWSWTVPHNKLNVTIDNNAHLGASYNKPQNNFTIAAVSPGKWWFPFFLLSKKQLANFFNQIGEQARTGFLLYTLGRIVWKCWSVDFQFASLARKGKGANNRQMAQTPYITAVHS